MSLGASRPWTEVIRIATRGRNDRLDAGPMIDYFKSLAIWLSVQNNHEKMIGWVTSEQDSGIFFK